MAAGYNASQLRLLLPGGIDNSQPGKLWGYYSPTDADSTVAAAGYITDAVQQGMQVGDLVIVYDVTNTIVKSHQVLTFTGNAANLSGGTTIGAAS